MTDVAENLSNVRARIAAAEQKAGRVAGSVTLLAVSKTKSVELIEVAVAAGQRVFAESYVQEAIAKQTVLVDLPLQWHFVGPIQSNKTRLIAEHFDWVHSIDRRKIAQRLNDQRPADMQPINVLLQVNISNELSKSGSDISEIKNLLESIMKLPRLSLRGLMAIPVKTTDYAEQRQAFRCLAELKTELNETFGLSMDCLSMGMSNDMEAAIAEGATHVRVGTGIFGARDNK